MTLPDVPAAPARGRPSRFGAAMLRTIRRLAGNLVGTACLALPLPAPRRLFHFDLDQLFLLIVLGFAADILSEYLLAEPHVRFWSAGLASESLATLALLIACYLAARLARAATATLGLMILAVAGGIVLDIPGTIGMSFSDEDAGWVATHVWLLVFVLWFGLFGMRAMLLLLPKPRRPAALLGVLIVLGPLTPNTLDASYSFWYAPPRQQQARAKPPLDVEQTYYAQPALLQRALAGVGAHPEGAPALYFVGFAGWAEQDVFLKEGRYAQRLFDEHFGTAGLSILLANNRASVAELPLASVSNLGAVLDGIGARMDRDEDVLFLFLTSHGSPGDFAVRFAPLGLDSLPAAKLRALLDHARIRWRVIVISACYSGSFVDALKDDRTLVMTAARQDRTSFGCANENDFTYFGEAYFSQALQQTRSFVDAFDLAKASIAAREQTEGLTPSEPQIFIGDAIRPKLAEIEAGLPK